MTAGSAPGVEALPEVGRLETQVERLLELVSPRVGLVRSLSRLTRGLEEPNPPFIYQAVLSNFDFRKADIQERMAAGKGATEAAAMAGAIGEAVEHYCASQVDEASLRRISLADAGPHSVPPAEFVLYSDSQYATKKLPYVRPEAQMELGWVTGRKLPQDDEVLVPASLTYLNYSGQAGEPYLCPATSNGLAAGPDLESAMLSGLYELVERDAFLITWMNKLPVLSVDIASLGGLAKSICSHYRRFGVQMEIYDMTLDLPAYVMMACAVDLSGKGPAVVVGLGCNLNPEIALEKALMEICQSRPGEVMRYLKHAPRDRLRSYQDVKVLEDHSAFASMPETLSEFSFLRDGDRTERLGDLANRSRGSSKADLDQCVEVLRVRQSRVVCVDLTTSDVAPFDLKVVRMIATGLQPIHFGFGEERLGGRRLYEVPEFLGYATRRRTEEDLNPCPHPLP
jgi:ribosomal protein S12 methylthiotransferase accessory factor